MEPHVRHSPAEWLVASCGMWQIGLGLCFMFVRLAFPPVAWTAAIFLYARTRATTRGPGS